MKMKNRLQGQKNASPQRHAVVSISLQEVCTDRSTEAATMISSLSSLVIMLMP